MSLDKEQLKRWRLVLGASTQDQLAGLGGGQLDLTSDQCMMDEALAAIYDETEEGKKAHAPRAWGAVHHAWPSGWAIFEPTSPKTW